MNMQTKLKVLAITGLLFCAAWVGTAFGHGEIVADGVIVDGQPVGAGGDAADITYTNNPTYDTVEDALDTLLYVSPSVSLSGGGTFEIGTVITNADLTWTVNKTMVSRELTGPTNVSFGAGGSGAYTHTNALLELTTKTYTMTVNDGTNPDADTNRWYFRSRLYYGFSDVSSSIVSSNVLALVGGGEPLRTTYTLSETTVTPDSLQYIWVCYPSAWSGTPEFKVNTFPTTFESAETITHTNASGYATSYDCYRSPNPYSSSKLLEVE